MNHDDDASRPEPERSEALAPPDSWVADATKGSKFTEALRAKLTGHLEKHRRHLVVDLGIRLWERDRESAGTLVGSAVAFRLFLFFAPLVLFAVGIAGFLGTYVEQDDVEHAGVTGALATQVGSALSQPNSARWLAVLTGAFGMALAGRTLSRVMVAASCLSWRLPVRVKASPRLIGALVGLLFGMALIATLINQVRTHLGLAGAGFSFVMVFVCYAVAWVLLSQLLPKPTNDPGALIPGACLVGLVLAALQAVSQLFLPDQLDRASHLYGAIGTTLVTLGWFFILGRTVVFSMSLDAVIYERLGSITGFIFGLPLLRRLPANWPWLRRYFDLGGESEGSGSSSDPAKPL